MKKNAFTLVELLVVIAIIGMLVGLLLPAVQQAREAARRLQCNNHLRQMGLASLNLECQQGHYPTGGWNWRFTGDADAGFGVGQMGGWTYSLLPFVEQNALYQFGTDGDPGTESTVQKSGARQRVESPIPIFYCPSRRACKVYKCCSQIVNCDMPSGTGKTDYAANTGNSMHNNDVKDYASSKDYDWKDPTSTGVIFGRSTISSSQIRDGTTNTYLIGEKYLIPDDYETGSANSDDGPMYAGADWDACRIPASYHLPYQDRTGYCSGSYSFGSCHAGSFGMAMCDGSVQSIPYSIDPQVHQYLGDRKDGKVVALPNP